MKALLTLIHGWSIQSRIKNNAWRSNLESPTPGLSMARILKWKLEYLRPLLLSNCASLIYSYSNKRHAGIYTHTMKGSTTRTLLIKNHSCTRENYIYPLTLRAKWNSFYFSLFSSRFCRFLSVFFSALIHRSLTRSSFSFYPIPACWLQARKKYTQISLRGSPIVVVQLSI